MRRPLVSTLAGVFAGVFGVAAVCGGCRGEAEPLGDLVTWDEHDLDFGPVALNDEARRTLALTFRGDESVRVWLDVTGRGFSLDERTIVLSPGAPRRITVRFTPLALGTATGTLVATWAGGTATLRLEADVVQAGLRVFPGRLDLGPVVVGRTRSATIAVENRGPRSVLVEALATEALPRCADVPRDPPTDRSVDGSFCLETRGPFRLAAGGSTEVRLRYAPPDDARHFVTLTLDCATCDAVEVDAQGRGLRRSLDCPAALDLRRQRARVRVDATFETTLPCVNRGHEPLTIEGLAWTGDAAFSSPLGAPFQIAPGATLEVPVRFAPTRFGGHAATLVVDVGAPLPHEATEVAVFGVGGGPALVATPAPIDAGEVATGVEHRVRFEIANSGDQPLDVGAIAVGDRRTPQALWLAPGSSAVVDATLVGPAPGPFALPLTFETNDAFAPTSEVFGVAAVYGPCALEVPERVSLGVGAPYRPVVGQVSLQNVGTEACALFGARFDRDAGADYRLPDAATGPTRLAPGATAAVWVESDPRVGTSTAVLELSTSAGPVEVPITAAVDPEALLLAPAHLDFGVRPEACGPATEIVRAYATTPGGATLTRVRVEGTDFELAGAPDLRTGPVDLDKGVRTPLSVTYWPHAGQTSTGRLVVATRAEDGTSRVQSIPLRGRGEAAPRLTERFVQLERSALDLLFVVDNSCTGQEQMSLAVNYADLVRVVHAAELEAQIGVTTNSLTREDGRLFHPDRPRGNGFGGPEAHKLIEIGQPGDAELFATAVQAVNLRGGGALEDAARAATYRALSPERLDGHNRGLLRRDAHLSVLMLMDERDQTDLVEAPNLPGQSVDVFRDALWALKGYRGRDAVSVVSIAGDVPGGCSGLGGSAQAAPDLLRLATETHGDFFSICEMGPAGSLASLGGPLAGQRSAFWLKQPADLGSIVVRVNGVPLPRTAWRYDARDPSVHLVTAFVPEPGQRLEVEYTPACL